MIKTTVLNRAVLGKSTCLTCKKKSHHTNAARQFLSRKFPDSTLLIGEDPGFPILGVQSLAKFGSHVFERKKLKFAIAAPKSAPVRFRSAPWPDLKVPLSLTVGKGGVGKTTISAGLAFTQEDIDGLRSTYALSILPPRSTMFSGQRLAMRCSPFLEIPSSVLVRWTR